MGYSEFIEGPDALRTCKDLIKLKELLIKWII
jgi:hypothetical protein